MTFDIYVWKAPRDLDPDRAKALVQGWQAAGGDPAASPFEPSTDVGWFYRELMRDEPQLVASSDAIPGTSRVPIWLQTDDPAPTRVAAFRLTAGTGPDDVDAVASLAAKYDLVLFDARSGLVHLPLAETSAYASATFWPRGAVQAAVAGGAGGVIALVAWLLGIPLLSGVAMLIGGFLVVMSVATFVREGRHAIGRRRREKSWPAE